MRIIYIFVKFVRFIFNFPLLIIIKIGSTYSYLLKFLDIRNHDTFWEENLQKEADKKKSKKIFLDKKKFLKLVILSLFILNLKNIVRIQDKFERDDFWKFTNFPFYNAQEIKKIKDRKTLNIEKEKFFYIKIFKPGPT